MLVENKGLSLDTGGTSVGCKWSGMKEIEGGWINSVLSTT
jgi:hypothetical protein